MTFARIAGTGSYLPDNIVTNRDLEQKVETSDQWIRERTGIEQRHIALPGQSTVDLAEQAALNAIEAAGIEATDIDLIVFATTTPDKVFPSCACILQARLGIQAAPPLIFRPSAAVSSMRWPLPRSSSVPVQAKKRW